MESISDPLLVAWHLLPLEASLNNNGLNPVLCSICVVIGVAGILAFAALYDNFSKKRGALNWLLAAVFIVLAVLAVVWTVAWVVALTATRS